ncbi:MAG: hypothetical protein K6E19_10785 [Lachnospiraceae bacterium]|nr:hypothetical protein [Lachnospiraceae bacterium]
MSNQGLLKSKKRVSSEVPEAIHQDRTTELEQSFDRQELTQTHAPVMSRRERERQFGTLAPLYLKVGEASQRDIRIVKQRYDEVNAAFDEATRKFADTCRDELKKHKDVESRKKCNDDLKPVIAFGLLIQKKRDMLTGLMSNQEEKRVVSEVDRKYETFECENIVSPFLSEYDETAEVIGMMTVNISYITKAIENYDDPVIFSHFAKIADSNFTNWENDPGADGETPDYREILSKEKIRAETFRSAVKVKTEGERKLYRFNKDFVDSYLTSVRRLGTSEEAERMLGFDTAFDPIKIGKNLWPEAAERKDEAARWRTDILYSTRMNYELFLKIATKYSDSSRSFNREEKALVDSFTGIGAALLPVFKAVSAAFEKAMAKKDADPEKLYSQYVELSAGIGELFGHMRKSYHNLYDRISADSQFTIGNTAQVLNAQVQALKAMSYDGDKPLDLDKLSLDDVSKLCSEMVSSGEMLINYADDAIENEPVERNIRGVRYSAEFGIMAADADVEFDEITDRLKTRHEQDEARKSAHLAEESRIRQLKERRAIQLREKERLEEELRQFKREEAIAAEIEAHQTVHITHLHGIEKGYVPKDSLGKIRSFTDYEGKKVESVGKMKAFFDKKKLKGDAIRVRMEKHVRLFLSDREGVTDAGMMRTAVNLFSSCGIKDLVKKEKSLNISDKIKLNKIFELTESGVSTDVRSVIAEIKETKLIPDADPSTEIAFDSPFMMQHTDAARLILLHKLMLGMTEESLGAGVSASVKDRVLAIKSNVNLMYNALTGSEEYKEALRAQKVLFIESALKHTGELITDIEAQLDTYEPEASLSETDKISQAQIDRLEQMVSDSSHAAITLGTQRHEHEKLARHTVSKEEIDKRLDALRAEMANTTIRLKKPEKRFDYEKLQKRVEEELSQTAYAHFEAEMAARVSGWKELPADEKRFITEQAMRQIQYIMPKDIQDIRRFTASDMSYFVGIIAGRLKGRDLTKIREKREEASRFKEAIVAECWSSKFDKGAFVKLKGLEKSTAPGAGAMRGERRIERIRGLAPLVKKACKELGTKAPKTFYEFCETGDYIKAGTITGGKKGYDKALKDYRKYIDSCFPNEDVVFEKPFFIDGKERKTAGDVASLIKKYYSEYGADEGGEAVSRTLESVLNKEHNADYQKELFAKHIKYRERLEITRDFYKAHGAKFSEEIKGYLSDALYAEDSVWGNVQNHLTEYVDLQKRDPAIVERTGQRIKALRELNGGQLTVLLPVLLKNPDFADRIASLDEDEYLTFLSQRMPRCNDVILNMMKYGYIDQYIIERGSRMAEYVMSDETANLDEYLGLKELTSQIDGQQIIYNGSTMTFKEAIGAELTKSAAEKENGPEAFFHGALVMEVLAKEGAAAILNTAKMKAHRERIDVNVATLKEILADESLFTKKLETGETVPLTENERKAALISIYHNERKNVLFASADRYKRHLRSRIKNDISVITFNFVQAAKLTKVNEEQKIFGAVIRDQKKEGREYFRSFTDESDKLLSTAAPDFKRGVFRDTDFSAEDKELLAEVYRDRKLFMQDPATAVIYNSVIKRMIAHSAGIKAENETDSNPVLVRRDIVALLSLRVFLNATDEFIVNKAIPAGLITEDETSAFRSGLMELYAAQIMSGAVTYTTKDYKKFIGELFTSKVENVFLDKKQGLGAARYIVDDWAGISSISSESATGERKDDTKSRTDFEKKLVKVMDKDSKAKFENFSNDAKVLFAHLLTRSTVGISLDDILRTALGQAAGIEEGIDLSTDAIVFNFLHGESMSGDLTMIDYASLTESLASKKEIIAETITLVSEITTTKDKMILLEKETEEERRLTLEQLHEELADAVSFANGTAYELKNNTKLPNNRKIWRYYTVLRTFALEFDQLDKTEENERTKEERELLEDYRQLQEYVLLLENERSWNQDTPEEDKTTVRESKQRIEDRFAKTLGLYGSVAEDEKRDEIYRGIRDYLYEKDSKKSQGELRVLDREEREYPRDVVAAVKKIDKWVAENTTKRLGDTESSFAGEILSHPFRERLFVYYVIEFKKYEAPTELDAAMALNGYVPDFEVFKKKMERSRFNLVHQLASGGLKNYGMIRETGAMDSYGVNKTHKLEAAMRTLDDQRFNMQERLKDISGKRGIAGKVELPKAVRVREACYINLVAEIARQKGLLDAKKRDEKAIAAQGNVVMRALSRLIAADGEVAATTGMELAKRDYLGEFGDRKTLKKPQDDDADYTQDVIEGVNLTSSLGDTAGDIVKEYQQLDILGHTISTWNLSDRGVSDLFKSVTAFRTLTGITSILSTIMEVKEGTDTKDSKTFSERILDRVHNLESVSDSVEDVCSIVEHIKPALKGALDNVTGYVSAGTQIIAGTFETAVALSRKYTVSKGETSAYKYVEARKERKETDKNEPEPISGEQLRQSISNVAKMQQRTLTGEATQGSLKLASGTAALIGLLLPVTAPLAEFASISLTVVAKIHAFWADAEQRKTTVDEFIDMNMLYARFMENFGKLSPEVQDRYLPKDKEGKRDEDKIKDMLRHEAVAAMHFSSLEDYFMNISEKYATILYREIFFDENGEQILASDTEKIEARRGLIDLFPGLRFGFPNEKGAWPDPPIDRMTENLTRSVGG